jgi:hypothetical protein
MRSPYVDALRTQLVDAAGREHPAARGWMLRLAPIAVAAALVVAANLGLRALDLGGTEREARPPQPERLSGRTLFGGTPAPGVRYVDRSLRPQVSFQVGDELWLAHDTDRSDLLMLERRRTPTSRGERAGLAALAFARLERVTDVRTGRSVAAPADLLAWLRRHPDVRAGRSGETKVAGLPARFLDTTIAFTRPAHHDRSCEAAATALSADPTAPATPCTQLFPGSGYVSGSRIRWLFVDAGNRTLTIAIQAWNPKAYQRIAHPAQQVLRSLRIG